MRAAIEAEVPLSHALELADGAALVVDETLLHVAPRPPPPVPPPRERLHELRLTVAQVAALGERFKAETRAPTLPLRAAIDVLLRAASAGELPPLWRRFERTVLHEACRLFTSGHAQQVSWHALLCALARMPAPTPAQLAEAAEALDRLALPGEKGGVALAGWEGVSLWFGARAARAAMDSAESHDGVAAADGDGAIAAVVPHGAAEFDVEAVRALPRRQDARRRAVGSRKEVAVQCAESTAPPPSPPSSPSLPLQPVTIRAWPVRRAASRR